MTNPIDPSKWPVRNQAAPQHAFPTVPAPLAGVGPSPGTFSGDFLRQLTIALCVGGTLYWLIDRKKKPAASSQVFVLHPDDLDAFEALQGGGGPSHGSYEPSGRAPYAASAFARDWSRR